MKQMMASLLVLQSFFLLNFSLGTVNADDGAQGAANDASALAHGGGHPRPPRPTPGTGPRPRPRPNSELTEESSAEALAHVGHPHRPHQPRPRPRPRPHFQGEQTQDTSDNANDPKDTSAAE